MIAIGIWVAFVVLALLLVLMRINKSFGKNLSSIICNIVSIVISFVIARVFVNSTAVKVGNEFLELIERKYPKGIGNLNSLGEFTEFAGSIVAGVLIFYVSYLIINIIMFIIKHVIIYRIIEKKEDNSENKNVALKRVGNLISTVLSVSLTFIVFISPIGFLYNSYTKNFTSNKEKIPFVSNLYLDKLTEMPENENNVYTTNEIDYTLYAISGIGEIQSKNGINKVRTAICYKTHFLPTIVAELASTGATYWKNGEEFLDYKPEIPDTREGTLYVELFEIIEKWNKKAVTEDVNTILNVYSQMLDYGIDKLSDGNGIVDALCKEEFTEELFVNLYKNEDFDQLIPVVIEYGLGSAFDYLEIDYDVSNFTKVDISKFSEEDVRREARLTADVVDVSRDIVTAVNKIESGDVTAQDIEKIEDKLIKIKDSKIVGDIAKELEFQIENLFDEFEF